MTLQSLSKKLFLSLAIMLFNSELYAFSQEQIKAVYLEKFTHLIQWPDNSRKEFLICVLNNEIFLRTLEELYLSKDFNSKPVRIISLSDKDTIPSCDLLFIGKATRHVDKITAQLRNKAVLTVSDTKEFHSQNIMLTLFVDKERFNYIVNNKAARDAQISISHLLLNSAQEVLR